MFDHISKHRGEKWKKHVPRNIFDELRGVGNYCQSLSWVFDVSSQSQLRIKWKYKIAKIICANLDQQSSNWFVVYQVNQRKSQPWRRFGYPVLISIDFDNLTSSFTRYFLLRLRTYIKHSRQCFIGYLNTSNFVKNTPLRVVYFQLLSCHITVVSQSSYLKAIIKRNAR